MRWRTRLDSLKTAQDGTSSNFSLSRFRIIELTKELGVVQDSEHHLVQDNRSLRERLEIATQRLDEVEAKAMDADEILKTKIQSQNETVSQLQRDLYEAQVTFFFSPITRHHRWKWKSFDRGYEQTQPRKERQNWRN